MKWFLRISLTLVAAVLIGVLAVAIINRCVYSQNSDRIENSMTEIRADESKRIAIVFGALVLENGKPSNTLHDRVLTAVELYRAGRVGKLLMSGDRRGDTYDEPGAMKKLAVELGVPTSEIVLDNDGKRTFDTCQRAKEIFGVEKAVLVTQDYHLPRSLYLCRGFGIDSLGIDSLGITANRRVYENEKYFHFRDFFSTASAWFEMNFLPLEPAKGEKRPIQ